MFVSEGVKPKFGRFQPAIKAPNKITMPIINKLMAIPEHFLSLILL